MTVLSLENLTVRRGPCAVLAQVSLSVAAGECIGLIGPNGAGKTTFVGLLSGRIPAQSGSVLLGGEDITRLPAHARVRRGVAYTFQITSVYPRLSVFDNVALAAQSAGASDLKAAVMAALSRVSLAEFVSDMAGNLSYGHQRLLELAMGLALSPRVLILDEPTQGLAAGEIEGFKALVRELVPQTTVLLIEHNMDVVMDLAHRITVLNFGQVLATGTPETVRANPRVQEAYLGGHDA